MFEEASFLWPLIDPWHQIMVLFVLRNPILHTRMHSHPAGLYVWFFVGPFVYFHTSCVRTQKALARLRACAGSPEPSLVANVISTIISWAGSSERTYWYLRCCNDFTLKCRVLLGRQRFRPNNSIRFIAFVTLNEPVHRPRIFSSEAISPCRNICICILLLWKRLHESQLTVMNSWKHFKASILFSRLFEPRHEKTCLRLFPTR